MKMVSGRARVTKTSQFIEESRMVGKEGREIHSEVFLLHTIDLGLKEQ